MRRRAFILGAGITGLSAGWKLAEAGFQVRVAEKEAAVGGMSGTFRHGPYRLDFGPHKIFTVLDPIRKELQGLFPPEELLRIKKRSRVRLRGRYLHFPLGLKDIFLGLGLWQGLQCGLGYACSTLNFFRKKTPVTYEEWVVSKFGRPIYNLVLGPYAGKVWGPPQGLSRELAESRIAAPNLLEMILQMVLGVRKNSPVINAEEFQYPKQGAGEISEKMAEKIRALGGKLTLRRELKEIRLDAKNRVRELVYGDHTRDILAPGDVCISTLPLPVLTAALGDRISDEVQSAVGRLKTRNLILLYVALPQDRLLEDNWLFFPEGKYPFNRIFEQKAFSPTMLPEGKTVLCAEITCAPGDEIWSLSDREIFSRIEPVLKEAGLLTGRVLETFTRRLEHAYPVYDLKFPENLETALDGFHAVENLYTVGRQGGFSYTGMADSMDIGFSTAGFIAEGRDKAGAWGEYSRKFYHYLVVD